MLNNKLKNIEQKYYDFLNSDSIVELNKDLDILKEFQKKFPKKNLNNINIDDYVVGKGNENSFCHILEYGKAKNLGSIKGGSANKFSLYYKKEIQDYVFDENLFISKEDAINNISKELFTIANSDSIEEVENSIFLKGMLRRKVFYMYNSEKIIPIFSDTVLFKIYNGLLSQEISETNTLLDYTKLQSELLSIYKSIKSENKNTFNFMVFLFKYSEDNDFIVNNIKSEKTIEKIAKETDTLSIFDEEFKRLEIQSKKSSEERTNIDFHETLKMKKTSFKIVVGLMGIEILLVFIIFFLVGRNILSFSDNTLNIFIGATIIQISVIFYWIIKRLFPNK